MNLEIAAICFDGDTTRVRWRDGSEIVVKRAPNDTPSRETAVALALAKKLYGGLPAFRRLIGRKTAIVRRPIVRNTPDKPRHGIEFGATGRPVP